MCLQPQCQCHCHRPISNWARKSLHHLWAPHLGLILQDTALFIQNSLMLKKKKGNAFSALAHCWCCWNIIRTVRRKFTEKCEGNTQRGKNNSFELPKTFRSWEQPQMLPPLPAQYSQSFPALLLPSPSPGMARARTGHTHKHTVYGSGQSPDLQR